MSVISVAQTRSGPATSKSCSSLLGVANDGFEYRYLCAYTAVRLYFYSPSWVWRLGHPRMSPQILAVPCICEGFYSCPRIPRARPVSLDHAIVVFPANALWLAEPGVESASMHPERPTLSGHAELVPMVPDKRLPCPDASAQCSGRFSQDITLFGSALEFGPEAGDLGLHASWLSACLELRGLAQRPRSHV